MNQVTKISWDQIRDAAETLAERQVHHKGRGAVWGIPTGGSVIAPFVAKALCIPVVPTRHSATLIVDDMIDSGATFNRFAELVKRDIPFDALFRKPSSPRSMAPNAIQLEGWLQFPWEKEARPEDAVTRLLQFIGEDPSRQGLRETPARVCRALRSMTEGYGESPEAILGTVFEESYDEIVVLRDIPFASLCEHHMLVFTGTADIGYLPGPKGVVGLSKLARLVDCFAKRLSVQEKMTRQIAEAIRDHLQAKGVAVVVRAQHSCMSCRGIKKPGSTMLTSSCLGVFRDNPAARAEFFALIGGK